MSNGKAFDRAARRVLPYGMVKTRVSSKGQTTIPRALLKVWKTKQVLWDVNSDGSARVSPAPDIMSLLGSAASEVPRDPDEKRKSRDSMGRNASEEGRSK